MNANTRTAGETAIVQYTYEGTPISFSNTDGVMVNATQMAKAFGKTPRHWLNNQQAKDFLQELATLRNLNPADLVKINNGGNNQGTWMHEDVAMEFARWLSPKFAIWTNDRIKELLTQGVATITDDDDIITHAMQVLQRRLDEKAQQLQIAETMVEEQRRQISTLEPLADYTRNVLQSTAYITFEQVAKELGMRSSAALIKFLHEHKVIYRQSNQWLPYANYSDRGFFATRTAAFTHRDGTPGSSRYTVITEKGRLFIRKFYNKAKNQQQ